MVCNYHINSRGPIETVLHTRRRAGWQSLRRSDVIQWTFVRQSIFDKWNPTYCQPKYPKCLSQFDEGSTQTFPFSTAWRFRGSPLSCRSRRWNSSHFPGSLPTLPQWLHMTTHCTVNAPVFLMSNVRLHCSNSDSKTLSYNSCNHQLRVAVNCIRSAQTD